MWPMSLFPGFGFMVLEQSAQFNESFYHCFTKKKKKKNPNMMTHAECWERGVEFCHHFICVTVCVCVCTLYESSPSQTNCILRPGTTSPQRLFFRISRAQLS